MQSDPDLFSAYAEKCEELARKAPDQTGKSLFLDLASQWRRLAFLRRTLELERQEREAMWRRGKRSGSSGRE